MKTFASLLAMVVLTIASGAVAQEPDDADDDAGNGDPYMRERAYGGIGGQWSNPNFSIPLLTANETRGINARLGYRPHPNVAFDLVFDYNTPFKLDIPGAFLVPGLSPYMTSRFQVGEVITYLITGNVRIFPLSTVPGMPGRIQPYLSAGLGPHIIDRDILFKRATIVPVATRLGGGVDVYATPHFAVSLDAAYVLNIHQALDTRYWMFGGNVQYHW